MRGLVACVLAAGCSFSTRIGGSTDGDGGSDGTADGIDAPMQPITGVPGGVMKPALWWLAADHGVALAGSEVTAWADNSAASCDLAAASTGERPTLTAINFNPALAFSNDRLVTAKSVFGTATYQALAVFVVLADDTNSTFDWVLHEGGNGFSRFSISRSFNGSSATDLDVTTTNRVTTSSALPGSLLTAVFDTQASTQVALYRDGVLAQTRSTFVPYAATGAVMQVGDNDLVADSSNNPFDGRLAEIYVLAASLTAAERRRIETYLAIKYGIARSGDYVASSGAVVWTGGDGYDQAIAGLGRDDAANLAQRQARSADGRALVTIGAGTIAATNAANPTALADGSYLVWGHDGGAITWETDEVPATVARRLAREYRIVETGAIGTVRIRVPDDLSSAPERLPVDGPGGVVLLVDADGDFSAGAQVVTMTLVGTSWEADADLAGTSYLTIGDL